MSRIPNTPTSSTGAQVDTYIESLNIIGAGNANTTVGGARVGLSVLSPDAMVITR